MNRKWSTTAIGAVGVGALAIGLLVPKFGALLLGHKKAEIRATALLDDGTYQCEQWAGDQWTSLSPYKFPPLSKGFLGDKIRWRGKDPSGNRAKVIVHFGQSPFAKNQYDDDQETSEVNSDAAYRDYPFDEVMVGGKECSKYVDPGVHVDR